MRRFWRTVRDRIDPQMVVTMYALQCVSRCSFLAAFMASANAVEITVKNDAITNFANAAIVTGFAVNEKAAAWLTSPCAGNVRAVQVFWRSQNGTAANSIEQSIEVLRAATFPQPGAVQASILGPVMNDGVLNEFRFLDENNTIPLNVAVAANEVFVVAFEFGNVPPQGSGPSLVRDVDGILPGRNGLLADIGGTFQWFNSATLGLTGDWVIRAVVDCPAVPTQVDVSIAMSATPAAYTAGQPITLDIVAANTGPAAAVGTTIVDLFPAALTNVNWSCVGNSGGTCPAATGSGNITAQINLPANAATTFSVNAIIANGVTGTISNSATAVVAATLTDTMPDNNTRTLDILPAGSPIIFQNGFE
jgi:uncharacterized repeat protein (TIGR01451 family)